MSVRIYAVRNTNTNIYLTWIFKNVMYTMYKLLTEREGNFGNYHPSKTNVNVGFASVDIDGRIKNSNAFEAISF